ncbi:MAG: type 4a pilus biogenesis protein PilO [Candidatus Omnitrophota bacterium]
MNVKEIIDKLQNVDVRDLKNIDFTQIQENIKSKPDILIIIALLAVSLSATMYFYVNFTKKTKDMEQKSVKYKEQLGSAEQNKTLKEKYDKFMAEFPEKIVIDDLIDKVSVFAINHNIKIISFSPAQENTDEYTKIDRININISAENYSDLINFMKNIEQTPYAIRVETWQGKLDSATSHTAAGQRSRRTIEPEVTAETKSTIAVTIEIAAISLIE